MKEIELTHGKFALVDDEDFEWLNQFKWFTAKGRHTYYAARIKPITRELIKMHRVILNLEYGDGIMGDHIDGNGLNNQRLNLRHCTRQQNQFNRAPNEGIRKSKYKGVQFYRNRRFPKYSYWRARISFNNMREYLGNFKTEVEAAKAYDKAAFGYFGEFARLNFPNGGSK